MRVSFWPDLYWRWTNRYWMSCTISTISVWRMRSFHLLNQSMTPTVIMLCNPSFVLIFVLTDISTAKKGKIRWPLVWRHFFQALFWGSHRVPDDLFQSTNSLMLSTRNDFWFNLILCTHTHRGTHPSGVRISRVVYFDVGDADLSYLWIGIVRSISVET